MEFITIRLKFEWNYKSNKRQAGRIEESYRQVGGRSEEGRRQVGGKSEEGRRKVGEISLKRAFETDTESGISECGFKKFGIQFVIK
jgi:hypothetical protein